MTTSISRFLLSRFRMFRDRRKEQRSVNVERRGDRRSRMERSEDDLQKATMDFERTVRIRRKDLLRESANDIQQTVVFSTYREICPQKGPEVGLVRFCRHPKNPDFADNDTAICDEKRCPRLKEALDAA